MKQVIFDAGFAGAFRWGPVNDVTLIDSEDLLVETFQSPDANTFGSSLTAANFLTYSSALHVVRTSNTAMKNASASGTVVLIANTSIYQATRATHRRQATRLESLAHNGRR